MSDLRDEQGAIVIRHTEFVADIFGPADSFFNLSYPLNPGMEKTFPWLSQVAQNFEEYEFKQLIFTYTSTITDIGASSNGQCGTITMATDYNANHKPFADKAEMLAYAHSHSTKTTQNMIHGVECDPNKTSGAPRKYVRAFDLSNNEDLKSYDLGIFEVGIANIPNDLISQSLGELRVTYSVVLRKPKLFVSRGLGISKDFFVTPSKTTTGAVGNLNNPLLVVSGKITSKVYKGVQNNLGCRLDVIPGNDFGYRIYFPDSYSGCLKVTIIAKLVTALSASGTNARIPITSFGTIIPLNEYYSEGGNPSPFFETQLQNGTAWGINSDFVSEICYYVRAAPTANTNYLQITSYLTGGASVTQTQVIIEEYNSYDKTRAAQINNVIDISSEIQYGGDAI